MPHDMHGHELKVGDIVMIPCIIKKIHLSEDYCNLDLQTKEFIYPTISPSNITLNSKQVAKA